MRYTKIELLQTGVYEICHVSGKRYIGSAAKSFERRWAAHLSQLRNNKHGNRHLQRVWNNDGEAAFSFRIIRVTEPCDALKCEQSFIDFYQSADPKMGYNILPKADSPSGRIMSDETKKKISERAKARGQSRECRDVMSSAAIKRHENNPELGRRSSRRMLKYYEDNPAARRMQSQATNERFLSPEFRKKHKQAMVEMYADPVRKATWQLKMRITRASKKLIILQETQP